MTAAAGFYGVNYHALDAAGGSSLALLPALLAKGPDLIGSHDVPIQVAEQAEKEDIPFLSVDLMPSQFGLYPYGAPDAEAGKLGGVLLAQGVQERLQGEWKDKEFFFLGFNYRSIPACVTRIAEAGEAMKASLDLDDDHILNLDPYGEGTSPEEALRSAMEAHPQAVFGLIPCWDQLGIDPYQAVERQGDESRILLVTLGGDRSNLEYLSSSPMGYYGLVEFDPFCEGWSWIETGVAILEGIDFEPYQIYRTITQVEAQARYIELYGNDEK
jgi:hypothetical protein